MDSEQQQRDLELVLNALEFYRLAVGEGISIENEDGHANDPEMVFAEYFEASGLPDEEGNYDRIPKRIYDRLVARLTPSSPASTTGAGSQAKEVCAAPQGDLA